MNQPAWPALGVVRLEEMLRHPQGRVRMVLDTDAFNEVDDQFALAYSLLSPEKLDVEAVTAAPFCNWNAASPGEGMEKSYHEIFKIYELMGVPSPPPVYRGSDRYMEAAGQPVRSDAVETIVERALASSDPLYVVAIGAITNVASAIALQPEIIRNIVVVWLGPNMRSWPHHRIFNVSQDYLASRLMYDCGVPLVILPCHGVASHLLTTPYEIDACLGGANRLCDYFCELFHGRHARFGQNQMGWSKVLWDISAIAWLLSESWAPAAVQMAPSLAPDFTYDFSSPTHVYKEVYSIDRSAVYMDMFRKLRTVR